MVGGYAHTANQAKKAGHFARGWLEWKEWAYWRDWFHHTDGWSWPRLRQSDPRHFRDLWVLPHVSYDVQTLRLDWPLRSLPGAHVLQIQQPKRLQIKLYGQARQLKIPTSIITLLIVGSWSYPQCLDSVGLQVPHDEAIWWNPYRLKLSWFADLQEHPQSWFLEKAGLHHRQKDGLTAVPEVPWLQKLLDSLQGFFDSGRKDAEQTLDRRVDGQSSIQRPDAAKAKVVQRNHLYNYLHANN